MGARLAVKIHRVGQSSKITLCVDVFRAMYYYFVGLIAPRVPI